MASRITAPAALLVVSLALAAGLMLLPDERRDAMKGALGAALRPGQQALLGVRAWAGRLTDRGRAYWDLGSALAESECRRTWLEQENRRLAAQLLKQEITSSRSSAAPQHALDEAAQPLLRPRCVVARVLGHQARSFLADQRILDAGSREGVGRDALVVDLPTSLIDLGRSAGIEQDQLVLNRGRVWGKIAEMGHQTSAVSTVTAPGYRDLVRLAEPENGPQGILEGTGEPLARIRMVEVTEPVTVGDAVYTAGQGGILTEPLLYGRVVRVERPVGAAHWEIWMQPAVPGEPQQVAVLRAELNPARVAVEIRNKK